MKALNGKKIIRFFSSLKLAVVVIVLLAIVTAVGTIIEAKYDAMSAQKWVYHSPYMIALLSFLAFQLFAVILDRFPWKRHHAGFITVHIGLIILLFGSYVTMKWGIDGSLSFPLNESARAVMLNTTEVSLWSSLDGERYTQLYKRDVDFFIDRPNKNPITIPTPKGNIVIDDYVPYAMIDRKYVESKDVKKGAGIRFQIQNEFVNVIDWLVQRDDMKGAVAPLGPAQIVLVTGDYRPTGRNEIVLQTQGDKPELKYTIYSSKKTPPKSGIAKAGSEIETGWMKLKFRVLNYFPHVEEEVKVTARKYPIDQVTRQVAKVSFNNQTHWLALNDIIRFFIGEEAYVLGYRNKTVDIGFNMTLRDFKVGRYQGTRRAASYQSEMDVDELGRVTISMNEPLKHKGFTFYQASFNEEPVVSILSVNRDPGRWIKYLGSLLVVLGTIMLFYFRGHYFPKT